jgi:hypothetical protein
MSNPSFTILRSAQLKVTTSLSGHVILCQRKIKIRGKGTQASPSACEQDARQRRFVFKDKKGYINIKI